MLLSGCAALSFQSPAHGGLYTSTQGPVAATSNYDGNASKEGTASATSILGIIGTGNASIEAAAQEANISEIHHVDYKTKSILGLYAKYTVVVHGE